MNHRFSVEGDIVNVHYLLVVIVGETMPGVVAMIRIRDTFRKGHGVWLVVRHIVTIDPAMWNALSSR